MGTPRFIAYMTIFVVVWIGLNIAGIYGAQIFRSDDKPRYRRAFSINIAVLAFGLLLAIARYIDDRLLRRKGRRRSSLGPAGTDSPSQLINVQGSEKAVEHKLDSPPIEVRQTAISKSAK